MDDAIETALEMSPRYQRHLHMPDKVIGWLDTAAVRAEIDRRWEVTAGDVVDVISNAAQIPTRHGVPRRGRPVQGHRAAAGQASDRSEEGGRGARTSSRHEQGTAQGRLRSTGRRPAVPRADRRRQDRAREGRCGIPLRRREEDDPHRHVRVPGRWRVDRQVDRHAARHRRQSARRHPDESAEGQPVHRRPARRDREGEPEPAEPVPAGVR